MTYEQIKAKLVESKPKIILLGCFGLVFLIGFGAGRYQQIDSSSNNRPAQADYNTNKPDLEAGAGEKKGEVKGAKAEAAEQPEQECAVKGNISAKGAKIYHVAGGAFYNITKPEQCFKTEEEAKASGFKKSSR